jgi:hypothetical protein
VTSLSGDCVRETCEIFAELTDGGEIVAVFEGLLFAVVLPLGVGDSDSCLSFRTEGFGGWLDIVGCMLYLYVWFSLVLGCGDDRYRESVV